MKLRKLLSLLLVFVLALVMLAGCGGDTAPSGSADGAENGDGGETAADPPASRQVIRISTGPLNAYSFTLYSGVADMINRRFPGYYNIAVENSSGSAENARNLILGNTDFGPIGMDLTLQAYEATGEFEGMEPGQLNHVATHSGTGATVHILVPQNSDMYTLQDLVGKKIGCGNSAMEQYFSHALETAGLSLDDMNITLLGLADLCNGFSDGTLDVIVYGTPAPSTNFTDLATTKGFRILDIGQDAVDQIVAKYPWYHEVPIEAGTYKGNDEDVISYAQYTVLCARPDTDEEIVYNWVSTMMEDPEGLVNIHPNAAGTTPERGVEGALIPIHPGAARYYQEKGVLD